MDETARQKVMTLTRPWLIVFLATVISGVAAIWSIMIVEAVARGFSLGATPLSSFGTFLFVTIAAAFVGAIVGTVSATLCVLVMPATPARRIILSIVFPSIVVGVLTAPIFHVFSAVLVLFTQLIASLLISEPIHQDSDESSYCASCGYSLAGFDRAKTSVCPECGEALPVRSETEEEEKNG